MIGSGIFKVPSVIAGRLPGPLPMLSVWFVGAAVALCGALTISEVGAAFPYSGGFYVYIREAYGRLPAFLFGWSNLLTQPASNGAVAIVFSQYALRLVGVDSVHPTFAPATAMLAILSMALVTVANIRGVRLGASIQNVTTLAKAGGLVALILCAFSLGLPKAGAHFSPAVPPGSFSLSMFGLSLVSVLFAYDGWMNIVYIGGEVLEPRRNVPRCIIFGVSIVAGIYITANFAYLIVSPVAEMATSQIIAADTMVKLVGTFGLTFIVATVMLSTLGALNAGMLSSPRIYYAMSEDRLFFEPLARVHPRFKTPYIAVAMLGVLSVLYILSATALSGSKAFTALIDACVVANLPFYALAVGSIFVFRRREKRRLMNSAAGGSEMADSLVDPVQPGHPEAHPHAYSPPLHAPLYPLTPVLFIASTLFLLGNSLLDSSSRIPSLIVLGLLAIGAPIYRMTIGRQAHR